MAFRAAFEAARRASGLPLASMHAEEHLDLRHLDRTYRVPVEPGEGQRAEPFFATALFSWRWNALHTARTATTDEDIVTEFFGPTLRSPFQPCPGGCASTSN